MRSVPKLPKGKKGDCPQFPQKEKRGQVPNCQKGKKGTVPKLLKRKKRDRPLNFDNIISHIYRYSNKMLQMIQL